MSVLRWQDISNRIEKNVYSRWMPTLCIYSNPKQPTPSGKSVAVNLSEIFC